jgi:uncharacterized protein YjcR
LLGAINDELAEFFGVSPSTIDRWIAERGNFGDAVKRGRVVADHWVERGRYDRADPSPQVVDVALLEAARACVTRDGD